MQLEWYDLVVRNIWDYIIENEIPSTMYQREDKNKKESRFYFTENRDYSTFVKVVEREFHVKLFYDKKQNYMEFVATIE